MDNPEVRIFPSACDLISDPSLMETMTEDDIRKCFLNEGFRRKVDEAVGRHTKYFCVMDVDGRVLSITVNQLSSSASIDYEGKIDSWLHYADPQYSEEDFKIIKARLKGTTLGKKCETLWNRVLQLRQDKMQNEGFFQKKLRQLFGL